MQLTEIRIEQLLIALTVLTCWAIASGAAAWM